MLQTVHIGSDRSSNQKVLRDIYDGLVENPNGQKYSPISFLILCN